MSGHEKVVETDSRVNKQRFMALLFIAAAETFADLCEVSPEEREKGLSMDDLADEFGIPSAELHVLLRPFIAQGIISVSEHPRELVEDSMETFYNLNRDAFFKLSVGLET